jgi:hypothetical protein
MVWSCHTEKCQWKNFVIATKAGDVISNETGHRRLQGTPFPTSSPFVPVVLRLPLQRSGTEPYCMIKKVVTYRHHPTLAVDPLPLLLRVRKVPGSILGPKTGYPEFFVVFLSPSKRMLELCFKLGHNRLLPNTFHFINDVTIRRHVLFEVHTVLTTKVQSYRL